MVWSILYHFRPMLFLLNIGCSRIVILSLFVIVVACVSFHERYSACGAHLGHDIL